ncbi:MAG: ribose-phosphate pyrophosphokinase, partial [Lachnospiraceae bacterium]|nr:ribose-phosphate pyrophosphokinase [Lachnospiraceae bacterium]
MIRLNNKKVGINYFPDGTLLLKEAITDTDDKNAVIEIKWNYENNEELLVIYFLTKHIQAAGYHNLILNMPYIPNARQDRVKNPEDVFTLKYFAEFINNLDFAEVRVLDAHSHVSLALIDRVRQDTPQKYIEKVIDEIEQDTGKKPLMFYPDEGAGKRYSGMFP